MKIDVKRIYDDGDCTIGALYIDRKFECFTLEDEKREQKVHSETRIPEGSYCVGLRPVGGFHKRYSGKFPTIHKGMLQVLDVPGFEYVLIHIGNDDEDTAGCLLVGSDLGWIDGQRAVVQSTRAYKRLYPKVLRAIESADVVEISYYDLEG